MVANTVWFTHSYQYTENPLQSNVVAALSILGLHTNLCSRCSIWVPPDFRNTSENRL